jgi:hypothetical protein
MKALSCNQCCGGKAESITYFECVFVALIIQRAKRMHHTVIVACPALLHFSTLSHKRQYFRKKKKDNEMKCMLWFSLQLLSENFLIIRRIERYVIEHLYWLSCKVTSCSCPILMSLWFSRQIFEKYSNIMFIEYINNIYYRQTQLALSNDYH